MKEKMLSLKEEILEVQLPEGKTQQELIANLLSELADSKFVKTLYGIDVKINGRITTGMAMVLGHKLAHICKSVSIFDPKMNQFVEAIWH